MKVRGWEKIFHANGHDRKAGVAKFISDKLDFKMRSIKKDNEGNYLTIKGSFPEEAINIINIYAPNIGTSGYLQQILRDIIREIYGNTIIVEDFDTRHTSMDRSSREKTK